MMAKFTSPLDNIRVASPCPANWNEMNGSDRVRFCGECQLNVYNLSGMTRSEAEHLISNAEGRLCVRYYKRTDGSIITQNCPVGLAALKRRVSRAATAFLSAVITFFGGVGFFAAFGESETLSGGGRTMGTIAIENRTPPPDVEIVQGDVSEQIEVKGKMTEQGQAKLPLTQIKSSPKRSNR